MGEQSTSCFYGFAGPFWPLDEAYLSGIVSTYYQEYVRLFLIKYEAKLSRSTQGLAGIMEQSATKLTSFDTAWHFACAGVRESVANNASDDDAMESAVSYSMHALASGISGEFHAFSEGGFRPIWRDRLLARARRIHVWRRDDQAAIAADGLVTALAPIHGGNEASRLQIMRSRNIHLTMLSPEAADRIGCPPPPLLAPSDISLAKENFLAAMDILEGHAPIFARWVGRVMTFVAPVDGLPGLMQSGSSRQWPGVAEISFRCEPVAIAEMLVHEATHQYFNILMMLDPVTDGTDSRLYYSPMRKRGRPIEMILLAYHAFANVLMFYRECRRSGLVDAGYCERNEQELVPDLRELDNALMTTNSLTEAGKALWRPLRPYITQHA